MNKKLEKIYTYNLSTEEYFGVKEEDYGKENYDTHFLEQYKILVHSSERVSDKRATTNSFFLTLNTILGTASIILFDVLDNNILLIPIGILGILFSVLWFIIIFNYKKLNTAKYNVINNIENKLPIRAFYSEWEILKKKTKYKELTIFEMSIPWIVAALYLVLIIIVSIFH